MIPNPNSPQNPPKITLPIPATTTNFTGTEYKKDPETGYLVSTRVGMVLGLTLDKKKLAVKFAKEYWPSYIKIARAIGVSRLTLTNHIAVDEQFRLDIQEAANEALDELEDVMREVGKTPRGYMDRITLLRAYRGERYNPDRQINIQHTVSREEIDTKRKQLDNVIDVELIQDRKDEQG